MKRKIRIALRLEEHVVVRKRTIGGAEESAPAEDSGKHLIDRLRSLLEKQSKKEKENFQCDDEL